MDSNLDLGRFAKGDPDAVRVLYQRYSGAVFMVGLRSLGDRGLAEEAVQQTFLQAWKAADRFDAEREPAPWLYAIARRVCIDLYRRERRHQHESEVEMAVLPAGLDEAWEHWQVRVALDRLPPEEREVIRCTHFLGLTQAETAERLGVALGTVKSRSFRGYRRLAVALGHLRRVAG